jgi:NAD dependent epimerase/dehydratase family enzyme
MQTEPSLALTGRRCAPKRFLQTGFKFQFPELRDALQDIYG